MPEPEKVIDLLQRQLERANKLLDLEKDLSLAKDGLLTHYRIGGITRGDRALSKMETVMAAISALEAKDV